MRLIAKNDSLFQTLKNVEVRILDSKITKILIYKQSIEDVIIEIDFDQFAFEGYVFKIKFSGIRKYSFNYSHANTFLIVESFTLLKHDGLYYLCVDPEDERSDIISENDQDFIMCGEIEGYFIEL